MLGPSVLYRICWGAGEENRNQTNFSRRTHGKLPGSKRETGAQVKRLCTADSRTCSGPGTRRRKRNSSWPLPRTAARNSVCCKRPLICKGNSHHLGRKTICRSSFRLQRHGYRALESRWRCSDRQSLHGRAGGRYGLHVRIRFLQGEGKNPWDTNCWTCGSSSGSGAIVAAGLAGFAIGTETWGSIICPVRVLRNQRLATHVWPRQPLRSHGVGIFHGQNWADGPVCRRLHAHFCGDCRSRSSGPRHTRRGQGCVYLFSCR